MDLLPFLNKSAGNVKKVNFQPAHGVSINKMALAGKICKESWHFSRQSQPFRQLLSEIKDHMFQK